MKIFRSFIYKPTLMIDFSFKIEKGIPAPKTVKSQKYPFADMEKGNSFFIKTNCEKRLAQTRITNSAVNFVKRLKPNWKFTVRVLEDGVRCWRTK